MFYAHIILFRNIKYADCILCRYTSYDKLYIYHSHTHIKCIHVVVTTSFPCNNVCSSTMYLSSIQTFAFLWRFLELPAEFHLHKADLFAVVYPPANLVEQSAKQRMT